MFFFPHNCKFIYYCNSAFMYCNFEITSQFCIYVLQFFVYIEERLRVNPNSLSSPFPLVVHVHVRVRANSGFDRGVGVRGRYPLKPSIFSSLLETKGYQNTVIIQRVFSASIIDLKLRRSCFVLYTVLYIYICNHVLNWNVFKNRYFNVTLLICTTVPHFSD